MITDYTPGAYVTHDMLHMRGGHQVDWLIDGVPIPNTNIATNLAPQFDPKDIDYVEILAAATTPSTATARTGIFNIVPRTGFERDDECELVTTSEAFIKRTTKSTSAAIRSALPTMPV